MRCARTLAIPVVGPAWLVESAAAGSLLAVDAYLWPPSCEPAPWEGAEGKAEEGAEDKEEGKEEGKVGDKVGDRVGAAEAAPRSQPSLSEHPPPPQPPVD